MVVVFFWVLVGSCGFWWVLWGLVRERFSPSEPIRTYQNLSFFFWVLVSSCGFLWVLVGSGEFLWVLVGSGEFLWVLVSSRGFFGVWFGSAFPHQNLLDPIRPHQPHRSHPPLL